MKKPATAGEAQRIVDALHQEQRDLPGAIVAARRAGDVETFFKLENRREDLPGEVDAAQAALLLLRLAEQWDLVETLAVADAEAEAAADAARTALEQHDATRPRRNDPDWDHAHALLVIAYRQAVEKARMAREDTLVAFAGVDDLEDQLELVTGHRAAGGDGLRAAPRPLAGTFLLARPGQPLAVATLPAGTVPPRWAAWQLRRNPAAFLDEPGDGHPRWDLVDLRSERGVNIVSPATLGGSFGGWDQTGQPTDEQTEALQPAPRIDPPGPTIRHLAANLPPHHVRPDGPRGTDGTDGA